MNEKSQNIQILSAFEADPLDLNDFYSKMYPDRAHNLTTIWAWLNRSYFFENKIPLVIIQDNKIIAHAGMIPIKVLIAQKEYFANWFIDFSVLPQFQNKGLGMVLTNKWMDFADLNITFCNEKSMGVFKKYGWTESFNSYMHILPIRPFDHPQLTKRLPVFTRETLNLVTKPILTIQYKKNISKLDHYSLEILKQEQAEGFVDRKIEESSTGNQNLKIRPLRDFDFVKWRITGSPNFNKYLLYQVHDFKAIILPNDNHGKYIDVLWISDTSQQKSIKTMISHLGLWGLKKHYSYIRMYTSEKELSLYLKKKFFGYISHPRFAFFSSNTELFAKVQGKDWDWQLVDSDFEKF
jgi:hypothetical protein